MLMACVVAHRGAKGIAPENTLRAIQLAAAQGAEWVELDVMLTFDEVPIILHDKKARLIGTLGIKPVLVKNTPWQQMRHLQVPPPAGSEEPPAPIATLAQAVKLIHQLGMGLNLEIKPAAKGLGALTLERSLAVLQACPAISLVISSFDFSAIEAAKALAPNIPRALLYKKLASNWREAVRYYEVRSVHLAEKPLQQQEVIAIRELGLEVYCYTVNDIERGKELLQWGVNGLFSDFPDRFIRLPENSSKRIRAYGDAF